MEEAHHIEIFANTGAKEKVCFCYFHVLNCVALQAHKHPVAKGVGEKILRSSSSGRMTLSCPSIPKWNSAGSKFEAPLPVQLGPTIFYCMETPHKAPLMV